MIFIGVDVAAAKGVAVGVLRGDQPEVYTLPLFRGMGAPRLAAIRSWMLAAVPMDTAAAVVELPFGPRASFVLPSVAAVCMEAIQSAAPDAVVLDMPTSSWRLACFGKGNASKQEAEAMAASMGVEATEDEAEALCMALVARKRWMAEVATAGT